MAKSYYPSPIGLLEIIFTEQGIINITFIDEKKVDYKYFVNKNLRFMYNLIYDQLNEYFTGNRKKFYLPVVFQGTDFQVKVWKQLIRVPFGETRSYKEIAEAIGSPGAARAVGNANRKNPLPILVPCHRIIKTDGQLCGYASGIWRKKWLIEHEKRYNRKGRIQKVAWRIT